MGAVRYVAAWQRHRRGTALATLSGILCAATMPGVSSAQDPQPGGGCQAALAISDTRPQETDSFACAQRLARQGDLASAQVEFHALTVLDPGNVDYWFGLAQVQSWSGNDTDALQSLGRARELAPGYEEIWQLELSILAGQSERSARRRLVDLHEAAQARFGDADWLDETGGAARPAFRWEAGGDIDRLDNNTPDWHSAYVYLGVPVAERHLAYVSYARFDRFDLTDTQQAVGASIAFAGSWFASLDTRFSADPAFLPKSAIDINLGKRIGHDWVTSVGLAHRHYTGSEVFGAGATVERYFGKYRFAYLAQLAELNASVAITHRATFNYYADRGSQYGLSIAGGKEVESVNAGEVLSTDVFAVALSGRHPLGRYLSIAWRIGVHRQGDFYVRYSTGLSIAGGY